MPKILCPVDFSPAAINAAHYAAQVARKFESELILLHVEPEYKRALQEEDEHNGLEQKLSEKLHHLAEDLEMSHAITCHYRIDYNSLVDDIEEITSSERFGMVIMGTDGARDLSQTYIGSNTYRVASQIRAVLLSIPSDISYNQPGKVVFAVENPEEGKAHLLEVITFARSFQANISIVHVNSKGKPSMTDDFKKEVLGFFEDPDWLDFHELNDIDVSDALIHFMQHHPNSMMAMMEHDLPAMDRLFRTSTTKQIVENAGFPVLVFHA